MEDIAVIAHAQAQALVYVLKHTNGDYSRESIMKAATNLKDVTLPLLIPGAKLNVNSTNHAPIHQLRLMKFDGENWQSFGETLDL